MPAWNEQIRDIRQLRELRRKADEELYAAQTKLLKAQNQLRKVKSQETNVPTDPQIIQRLQRRISELEARLVEIEKQLKVINALLNKFKDLEQQIIFLEKRINVIAASITELTRRLQEEQQHRPPDRNKILELQKELELLRQQHKELQLILRKTIAERDQLRQQQEELLAKKQGLERERNAINEELKRLREELKNALAGSPPSVPGAEIETNELEQGRDRARINLNTAITNLHTGIGAIYVEDPHPRRAVANLDDNIPIVFLPVRIETRFMTIENVNELWLRIYPDDIAIHSHEKTLTDLEVDAGQTYWKQFFNAVKEDSEDKKKEVWNTLANKFGSNRAAWIAQQTKPTNWSDDLSGLTTENDLVFLAHDLTSVSSWSRAPRTQLLPDKFVVTLYHGETVAKEVVGNIIPDELIMGPDPLDGDQAFKPDSDELTFGESFDWTSNFEKAVEFGMGFKIPITADESRIGFDKIVALGVMLSADEREGKAEIEALIDNHHYSPDGFSLITQGTPTNNTEAGGAGFTASDPFNENYFVEVGDPKSDEADDCDGKQLAVALGIEALTLGYIKNTDATDHRDAIAMNTALYPSTLGYYFDTMMKPVLGENDQQSLRTFVTENVTGRGPIPAIRVGNQPYGVLLTSDFSKWKWHNETAFHNMLYNVLVHYNNIWKELLPQLMFTGKPGIDPSDILMNILGLQPGSVSFLQRIAYSTDNLINNAEFLGVPRYVEELRNSFDSKDQLKTFLRGFGYDSNGPNRVPQLLRLVFRHLHKVLDAANLVDNVPLSEKDPIRNFDEATKKNYIHWLVENVSIASLEKQELTLPPAPPLLYLQLRRALLLELNKASVNWFKKGNIELDQVLQPVNFHNIRPAGNITKWEVMKAKVSTALPSHPEHNLAVADFLLTTGSNESEADYLKKMKEALKDLSDLPTADLERCLTEHFDICTYRLDAWQTGMFNYRLKKQRANNRNGVYLGAYGCVMDVKPSAKRRVVTDEVQSRLQPANSSQLFEYADNGGFVHAPSIDQAKAAAVLRSGYLNHASPTQPEVMAVNLSSDRVRTAMLILDGIRQGQMIEALLGYQFERGLHDKGSANTDLRKLNEYIYNFRDAFMIEQHLLPQQGVAGTTETIQANNVVNGLRLAERQDAFPYGADIDLGLDPQIASDLRDAIIDEKSRLENTLDAVKDLLLSESVYQLVQGNADRAAAVTIALRDALVPPEIEIVNTPRSSHFTFTNRVTIQFEQLSPGSSPWPASMSPRAKFEPGLNKWLGDILGDPSQLTCSVTTEGDPTPIEISVDDIQVQPIDLIYFSGSEMNTGVEGRTGISELELRIATAFRSQIGLGDDVPVSISFTASTKTKLGDILPLLRSLKSMITSSRSLHAEDFTSLSRQVIADASNKKGYIVNELLDRVQTAFNDDYDALFKELTEPEITLTDGNVTMKLGTLYDQLDTNQKGFAILGITFAGISDLRSALLRIAGFGVANAFPSVLDVSSDKNKVIILEQARNTVRQMKVIREKVNAIIVGLGGDTETQINQLITAAKLMFGNSFTVLPKFKYNDPGSIHLAHQAESELLQHATTNVRMKFPADEWLQQMSHVRPQLAAWEYIRTLHEINKNEVLEAAPIQLPFRAKDSWIAVEFPQTNEDGTPFNINDDTLSIVVHGDAAFDTASPQCGLLVDDWTEMIPNKEEITGLTFHYNQPNAVAPQAILVAITPEETGEWSWDKLLGIVNDTFLRAKLRAVEPMLLDKVNKPEVGVLLPALLANFSKNDLDFSLDYAINDVFMAGNIPVSAISL